MTTLLRYLAVAVAVTVATSAKADDLHLSCESVKESFVPRIDLEVSADARTVREEVFGKTGSPNVKNYKDKDKVVLQNNETEIQFVEIGQDTITYGYYYPEGHFNSRENPQSIKIFDRHTAMFRRNDVDMLKCTKS